MNPTIMWSHLATSIQNYERRGFEYIEVPWSVPNEYTLATCAENRWVVSSILGDLVGSAEQSFLYLDDTDQLSCGRFMTCTPCFRNEDVVDELHQKTFMKVELYQNYDVDKDNLEEIVRIAMETMGTCDPRAYGRLSKQRLSETEIDLVIDDVEVGSYGLRQWRGLSWIYATGIAEPRFSTVMRNLVQ